MLYYLVIILVSGIFSLIFNNIYLSQVEFGEFGYFSAGTWELVDLFDAFIPRFSLGHIGYFSGQIV